MGQRVWRQSSAEDGGKMVDSGTNSKKMVTGGGIST